MNNSSNENIKINSVSYSQYAMWSTCKWQWKLAYHDKLKVRDNTISTIFGTAIHEAIQVWLDIYYNGEKNTLKHYDIVDDFKIRLFNLFKENIIVNEMEDGTKSSVFLCDQNTLKEFYLDGVAILNHIIKYKKQYFPTGAGIKLIGCEIPLEIRLKDNLDFVGYIDLVIHNTREKRLMIYDFKTSKAGWFYEKKDPKKINQILLYKKFYSQMFEIPEEQIEAKFMILKRKIKEDSPFKMNRVSNFEPAQGTTSVKKAIESFNNFVNSTFADNGTVLVDNLRPTPSEKNCKWCAFKLKKDLCPDGHYKEKRNGK